MSRRAVGVVLKLVPLFLMSIAAAAQEEPRVPMTNDNWASALSIKLNDKDGVEGIELASTEPSEPVSCPGTFSVWFKFTPPFSGKIALSTAGSVLYTSPTTFTHNTTIAVFTGSIGALTQVTCNDNGASQYGEIAEMNVTAGTTYSIRVAAVAPSLVGPSRYVLTTTVLTMSGYNLGQQNISFENPIGSDWVIKNPSGGDDRNCTVPTTTGSCAIRFFNGPDEQSKLIQKVPWPKQVMKVNESDTLAFYVDVNTDAASSPDVTVQMSIVYSDATPATKAKRLIFTQTTDYDQYVVAANVQSTKVKTVKVIVKNKSGGGQVLIDSAFLQYFGGLLREKDQAAPENLLPVPAAP